MSRAGLLLACALWAAAGARAGEIIPFGKGRVLPPEILTQSTTKAVVAEFLDPGDTGLGKAASFIVWREILTAISDQSGAGVIIASAPRDERLTDLLQKDYHEAAVRIAESQRARMALWGAVEEHAGKLVIDTYLTLLDDARGKELQLQWKLGNESLLAAGIKRTRFNFPIAQLARDALFDRPVIARAPLAVRARPDPGGDVKLTVPAGTVLRAYRMSGGWFEVKHPTVSGFVPIQGVDLPPPRAYVAANEVLRARPEAGAPAVARTGVASELPVSNMRYLPQSGLWFEVFTLAGVGWATGWISAARTKPRYSLPAVHFVAGLYRYLAGRWADADREFSQFIASPGAAADNASLATAHQLVGASRLMLAAQRGGTSEGGAWNAAFDEAIRLAPYDPAGYNLRAIAGMYGRGQLTLAGSQDLKRALALDPNDRDARAMVEKSLGLQDKVMKYNKLPYRFDSPDSVRAVQELKTRYAIP